MSRKEELELAKLEAEIELMNNEAKKFQLDVERIHLEIEQIKLDNLKRLEEFEQGRTKHLAEIEKLNAETKKLTKESLFYPLVVVAGVAGAVGGLVAKYL